MFAIAIDLLSCDGLSPYHCIVHQEDHAKVWALAHESVFPHPLKFSPCPDIYVTWSVLVHSTGDPGSCGCREGPSDGGIPCGAW